MSVRAPRLLMFAAAMLLGAPTGAVERAASAPVEAKDVFPVATGARLGGDERQTRFVVDFTRKIDLRAFALADPYRVVLDIPQVTFRLPSKARSQSRGLIEAYRYGLVMPGGSRIVLDVKKPVRIDKAFVLEASGGQPARLVLDLVAIDRETFLRNIALDNRIARAVAKPRKAARKAAGDPRPIIVIDPGHGGIDYGTQAARNGVLEKAIVLEFGLILRDKIEKTGKYRVVMTRTDDTFIPLADRVKLARERGAALFISIHCDSLRRSEGNAQGATIYTLSEKASDSEAARLAEAENRADVISGVDLTAEPDDVAGILIDLARRETKTFSVQFARTLAGEWKSVARLNKRPLRAAGFRVLKAPDVPSVLLELGYVSNRADLKQLTSDTWRKRTADTIVQSIDTFFATRMAGGGAQRP